MGKHGKKNTVPEAGADKRPNLRIWFPLAAALILYSNTFNGPFLYGDDEHMLVKNIYLENWKYLPNLFTENIWAGSGGFSNFYRPVIMSAYSLLVHIFGKVPWPFHALNILFHGLSGVLIAAILKKIIPAAGITACVLAATLWTVQPLAVEQILSAVGAADPMSMFWMLAALLAMIKLLEQPLPNPALPRDGGGEKQKNAGPKCRQIFYLIFSAFALLSKENAITVPALSILFHLCLRREGRAPALNISSFAKIHLPGWGLAALYAVSRLTLLDFGGTLNFYRQSNVYTENFFCRFFTFLSVLGKGLLVIFAPYDLHPERSWPVFCGFFNPNVWLPAVILAGLAVWVITAWRKKETALLCGLGWFLVSYAPTSNLLSKINAIFWDHWFYTPSFGIVFILLYLREKSGFFKKIFPWAAVACVLILSLITRKNSANWRSQETYSRYILSYEPNSAPHWNNLAIALSDRGEINSAIDAYRNSIRISDVYPQTHHNLGQAYRKTGRGDLAETEYDLALKLDPKFYYSHLALAELMLSRKDARGALEHLIEAKKIFPYIQGIDESIDRLSRIRK